MIDRNYYAFWTVVAMIATTAFAMIICLLYQIRDKL